MILSPCRKTVDTYAPWLGRSYRVLRDLGVSRWPVQTPFGFTLAGAPTMARADFEPDLAGTFLGFLDVHDAVLDIGANVGFYTCLAASRGKRVLSFEPSPRNLSFLYKNLASNNFSNVDVFPMGLAREPGTMPIFGFGGISSFVPEWAQAQRSRYTMVPVTTLDSALAGRLERGRLLIKMDVEGFEADVLAGAQAVLHRNPRPTWLLEILLRDPVIPGGINLRFAETFEAFWEAGYACLKLDSSRNPVSREDVRRWAADGFVESHTTNFLFFAEEQR
jgi:FkbM family methyltransferase